MSCTTRVHLRSSFLTQKEFLCDLSNFSKVILNCWKTWGKKIKSESSTTNFLSVQKMLNIMYNLWFWNKYSTFLNKSIFVTLISDKIISTIPRRSLKFKAVVPLEDWSLTLQGNKTVAILGTEVCCCSRCKEVKLKIIIGFLKQKKQRSQYNICPCMTYM